MRMKLCECSRGVMTSKEGCEQCRRETDALRQPIATRPRPKPRGGSERAKITLVSNNELERVMTEHPNALPLGKWIQARAHKERLTYRGIHARLERGHYPELQLVRINARVVLVTNP